jgi:heme o synthase
VNFFRQSLYLRWLISRWHQFYVLTKPRVLQLIVFCALIGMLLAIPGAPNMTQITTAIWACIGIWLVAGAAAAFNCIVEKHLDARMRRTSWRPTASGELGSTPALIFSLILFIMGSTILYWKVNALTMWLTFATFVGYAVIYTLLLKPATPQNIVIGGASGAMPPVLGWVALSNHVPTQACLLFLIIFLWTPPHFWSLCLYRSEEYRAAGLPMLPVTHGNLYTRGQIFLYTWLLLAACLLPFAIGMAGWLYLFFAFVLCLFFIWRAWKLLKDYSEELAKSTFRFSLIHLSGIFAALLIDHYIH